MDFNAYIGHESQVCSVEEVRLVGGKGDGMRLLQVRNAAGLEFTVSVDRCADLSRVVFKGDNMGYFSPCGYVAPAYYDQQGNHFLKSFTAGFLTTCGLTSVGAPCIDEGEEVPMHGTISNTPCDRVWWEETPNEIIIHARINHGEIFREKLLMERVITCGKFENILTISDTITNIGSEACPLMIMYHMNMGYPLLSEKAVVQIPSVSVIPRDESAEKGLACWDRMEKPTAGFSEQCFYHDFYKIGKASIYNPDIGKGLEITFNTAQLPYFTQWKMMGIRDYVLGLEPANCLTDGRDVMRKQGKLQFIQQGEKRQFSVNVLFKTAL